MELPKEKTLGLIRFILAEKAKEYFEEYYFPKMNALSYSLIWYAETLGYDGVWWEEDYAPWKLSAPRGVIFQEKLKEWKICKGHLSDEDHIVDYWTY